MAHAPRRVQSIVRRSQRRAFNSRSGRFSTLNLSRTPPAAREDAPDDGTICRRICERMGRDAPCAREAAAPNTPPPFDKTVKGKPGRCRSTLGFPHARSRQPAPGSVTSDQSVPDPLLSPLHAETTSRGFASSGQLPFAAPCLYRIPAFDGLTGVNRMRIKFAPSLRSSCENGAPDRIRTCGLCLRRATLYPSELRARESPPLRQSPVRGNRLGSLACASWYRTNAQRRLIWRPACRRRVAARRKTG